MALFKPPIGATSITDATTLNGKSEGSLSVASAINATNAINADYSTNADSATNADTLDNHHASEFATTGNIGLLPTASLTGTLAYYTGSAWATIPPGALGTVLMSNGEAMPTWETIGV